VFLIGEKLFPVFVIELRVFNDVTQTKTHVAEPIVFEPSAFDLEMSIEKLKRHKLPRIDHNPA
jgi:hypothetical protein